MKRLFGSLIPLLLLSACPESSTTPSTEPGGEEGGPDNNGGGGPTPFSNPNDARFSVAPGEGVTLNGEFVYTGETPGSSRLDFQRRESPNGPPMLVHTIELDAPGPWSLEVPKDYGPIYLTGFVDLKGDGPSPDDPMGRTTEPVNIAQEDINGVDLAVSLGGDAAIPSPPQPGENKPGENGEPAPEGAPGGDPAPEGAPGGPPEGTPDAPPSDAPPADEAVKSHDGPPADG